MPPYALGRLPSDPTKPKLRLRRSTVERPDPPASVDWLSLVREWGMLANSEVGCCTMAAAAHTAMAVDKYGQNRDLTIVDEDVLAAYAALTGWNPADPSTDTGATLQDALDFWRKTGIAGQQIAAFAFVDAGDLELVRACIATFGAVYTGMTVCQSALDELDRGQPWASTQRSRSLGGHCVPIGAYDQDSFTCITWGQAQRMSVGFFQRYFDEIAVPVDLDWLRANGTSPAGLDVSGLNSDFEALTGETGPFPNILPTPIEPCPDPDVELAAAFDAWKAAKGL